MEQGPESWAEHSLSPEGVYIEKSGFQRESVLRWRYFIGGAEWKVTKLRGVRCRDGIHGSLTGVGQLP